DRQQTLVTGRAHMALQLLLGLPRLDVKQVIPLADLLVQPATETAWLCAHQANDQPDDVDHFLARTGKWREREGDEDHESSSFPGSRCTASSSVSAKRNGRKEDTFCAAAREDCA